MRTSVCLLLFLAALVVATGKPAFGGAPPSLVATPQNPNVFQSVLFTFSAGSEGMVQVDFGDGSTFSNGSSSGMVSHGYATVGFKFARLCQPDCSVPGNQVASTVVVVRAPAPKVPFGAVSGTIVLGGPFLAGGDAQITFQLRVATQSAALATTPQTNFEVFVDLEDVRGRVIRRSDPTVLESLEASGGFPVRETISYTIPGDAKGEYRLRVYVRTDRGGVVALGQPVPIVIFGGPDPAPVAHEEFHASGAIITGPSTTTFGSTSNTVGQFQSNITAALEWPTETLSLTGLYDPVSKRSDPVLTLASASPGPVSGPDALGQTQTASNPPLGGAPQYTDTLGRTTTSLPQLLGGGDTLRGLDLTYKYADGWAYHAATGFTQIGTFATTERRGDAFDITRSWSNDDSLRAAFFGQSDNVDSFVPNHGLGPQSAGAGVLEFNGPILRNLTAIASVGRSQSHVLAPDASTIADAADKFGIAYALGSVDLTADYHNFGADFAVGGGPGALSDVAGSLATASASISPAASLIASWQRDDKRSTFSHHTDESATFATQPSSGFGMQLTALHDRMLAPGSAVTTDALTYAFFRTWLDGGSLSLSGSATGSSDALVAESATTVRTANISYGLQRGPQMIGGGVSSNVVVGPFSRTATVTENLNYGFAFGGRLGDARFYEIQLQALGGNTTSAFTRSRNSLYSIVLSRHLTQTTAMGLRVESGRTVSPFPPSSFTTSAVRLQLNLNI